MRIAAVIGLFATLLSAVRPVQEPTAPQTMSAEALKAAIDKLGDLDYATRTAASKTVRRTWAPQAVPALIQAVSDHADGYVRYRALVLLTGFNNPRTKDSMLEALASPNDRLRTVAYSYFEHNADAAMIPRFLEALEKELAEFVRPALVRALAAQGSDPRVRQALVREAGRGQDFFRSAVIEALGDYKAGYAFDAVTAVAKLEGPLQVDSVTALGKIGDKRALETLPGLQRTAPREAQPAVAAAICLLGINCDVHKKYLVETLKFSDQTTGFQPLLRSAAAALGTLALAGHADALEALLETGIPAHDATRAPIALAVATVALRGTPTLLTVLQRHTDRERAIELLGEGFDMLEEDFEKERFFTTVRSSFWLSQEGSPARQLMQTLIGKLDF